MYVKTYLQDHASKCIYIARRCAHSTRLKKLRRTPADRKSARGVYVKIAIHMHIDRMGEAKVDQTGVPMIIDHDVSLWYPGSR